MFCLNDDWLIMCSAAPTFNESMLIKKTDERLFQSAEEVNQMLVRSARVVI